VDDDRTAHRHTVLIAEDDCDTREAFVALACSVGVHAIEADNGRRPWHSFAAASGRARRRAPGLPR
jgi:hypothetical protein